MVIANFSPSPLRDSLPIQYPNITTAELINVYSIWLSVICLVHWKYSICVKFAHVVARYLVKSDIIYGGYCHRALAKIIKFVLISIDIAILSDQFNIDKAFVEVPLRCPKIDNLVLSLMDLITQYS